MKIHYSYIEELITVGSWLLFALKIIAGRFISQYMLIGPLSRFQSDMSYFFETNLQHSMSSVDQESLKRLDCAVKGDRHFPRTRKGWARVKFQARRDCFLMTEFVKQASRRCRATRGVLDRRGFTCSRAVITSATRKYIRGKRADAFSVMEERTRRAVRSSRPRAVTQRG